MNWNTCRQVIVVLLLSPLPPISQHPWHDEPVSDENKPKHCVNSYVESIQTNSSREYKYTRSTHMDRVSNSTILPSESLEERHHVNCAIPNMVAILVNVHSQICIHINVWLTGIETTSWVPTSRAQQGSLRGLTCMFDSHNQECRYDMQFSQRLNLLINLHITYATIVSCCHFMLNIIQKIE